jgi:hypothetical protein
MYIAFMIIHKNFNELYEKYFNTIQKAIYNCLEDKNYVHIYFNSKHNVHKYDKYFTHGRFKLIHTTFDNYINDIDTVKVCYHTKVSKEGFDYHWMVKVNPDLLIFDEFIFRDMRTKYSYKHIHARSRYYIGPLQLKKHQKSNWEPKSHIKYPKETLSIMDDQLYIIPYPLQYFAFKSSSVGIEDIPETQRKYQYEDLNNVRSLHDMTINQMVDSPERNQTILWNMFNIPLKISEFYVVSFKNLADYNLAHIQ